MLENRLNEIYQEICKLNSIADLVEFSTEILEFDTRIDDEGKKRLSNLKTYIKNGLCKALMNREKELVKIPEINLNLTHIFSKFLFNGLEIEKLPLIGHSRTIGVIPKVFLAKSDNPSQTAIQIFDLLAEYSMKLNYDFEVKIPTFENEKEYLANNVALFEKQLSIITKQSCKLEFIGSGFNGNGFKLTIDGQVFCYKIFYIYNKADIPNTCCHGTVAETQMALFSTANSRKDKFSKFYFGKIGYLYNIDSFLVTEFVDKSISKKNNSQFYLDHITTMDSNPRNRVSGKIVDFGATKIAIPELNDKKLRQLVRVICNCMMFSFDESKISYHWQISKKMLKQLHCYLKNKDYGVYLKSFDIILHNTCGITSEMQELFKNIKDFVPQENLIFDEVLFTNQLFTVNVEYLKSNLEFFDILKTETKPMPIFNSPGHIIVELFNGYQAVCFYRDDIERIRIEKLKERSFVTLLDITKDDFDNYQNRPMYELLKELSENSKLD